SQSSPWYTSDQWWYFPIASEIESLLIGRDANHSQVVVPSPCGVLERSRPGPTKVSGSGIRTATRCESGSSACESLLGHQIDAPTPWSVVTIQSRPSESFCQEMPPSHGGRGATVGRPLNHAVTWCT